MHGNDSHGSINIHDPILDSTPQLRSLKRQIPWALGVFVVGLFGGMMVLFWGVSAQSVLLIAPSATIMALSTAYFAYVTVRLSWLAERARRAETEQRLSRIVSQTGDEGAQRALDAVRRMK